MERADGPGGIDHSLTEDQRRALDEERDTNEVDRDIDQPRKRSRQEGRRRSRGDRVAETSHPEQYEEFLGPDTEPSERKDGPRSQDRSAG